MTRILFMSNWERTETWVAVGRELARRGITPFFSVTRRAYLDLALAAGVPRDHILWLTRQDARRAPIDPGLRARLEGLEARRGATVKSFSLMDRFMRSESPEWADRYTHYVFGALERFIHDNDIDIVAGQPDNIPDLLAEAIVKDRGGRYAAPFESRLPGGRFVLWDGPLEQSPHVTGTATPADVTADMLSAARALRDRVREGGRGRQVSDQARAPSPILPFLRKLVRGFAYRALIVSRSDVYMYTVRSVLFDLKYHMIPVNRRRLKWSWNRLFENVVPGERYVFYPLNYAPEHTLDVEAANFTNTFEAVRQVAMSLPLGVRLYVKEHPTALGIRGPRELKKLRRLPGVRMIDPEIDSHVLIRGALATVSLTGTASLEAALFGVPSLIVSDLFIQNFSTCRRLDAPWQVGEAIAAPPPEADDERDLRYLAWLISNSHEGTVLEPLVDPSSLLDANISLVADAFEKLVRGARPLVAIRDSK